MSPETPLQKVKADLAAYAAAERRPVSTLFTLRMFLLTPGFQFVFARRLQEMVVKVPLIGRLLRRIVWWATCLIFSSEIAIGAQVGGGLFVPHPYGIVIGQSKVGRNLRLLQNVTIGRRSQDDPRDPVFGDNVYISAGAVLLGAISIGDGAVIGANAVVLKDVPAGATAIGIPARIIPAATDPAASPAVAAAV